MVMTRARLIEAMLMKVEIQQLTSIVRMRLLAGETLAGPFDIRETLKRNVGKV